MYWSHDTGAHYLTGRVEHRYALLHQTHSPVGLPTSDIKEFPDKGFGAHFQHGVIYQGPHDHAHALWGSIFHKWRALGGRTSPLGYPTSDVNKLPKGGSHARFDHGDVYNGPDTVAHGVWGDIATTYRKLGEQTGPLGFPRTDVRKNGDGHGEHCAFTEGIIERRPDGAVHALWGEVATTYVKLGADRSPLGYPTSDLVTTLTGPQSATFDHGRITQAPGAATAFGVWGPIFDAWHDHGEDGGSLGFPITNVVTQPDGSLECDFEHGKITDKDGTVTVVVSP
jgi:uncharacterized protein with LGFP repeats